MEEGWLEIMTQLSEYMLDQTVTQKRKASDTGNSVEAWANVVTDLKMAIYPAGSFAIANYNNTRLSVKYSHDGFCYVADATFQVGDRVVNGTVNYLVLEIQQWDTLYQLKMGII